MAEVVVGAVPLAPALNNRFVFSQKCACFIFFLSEGFGRYSVVASCSWLVNFVSAFVLIVPFSSANSRFGEH